MRVCMLTTGFPRFRGDLFGAFVLELARELICQGVTVEVVAPHQAGLPTREVLDGVAVRRFRYLAPAAWQRVAYGGGIPTNLRASALVRCQVPLFMAGFTLAARRAASQADIVHCHWTASGVAGRGAILGRCQPLVLTVRGSDLHLQTGVAGRLNRRIWRRMDRVAAVSQDLADRLVQAGVERERVTVLRNGISGRFAPADRQAARERLGLPSDRFVLLFVGLLVPVKGLDLLLEALGRLADPRLLCVLVGEGSLQDELAAKAKARGLQEQVRFAGRQSSDEVPWWLNAADLLVLPSRSEGRPNVVLEAQACGVPVVATRVGGTPELIEDGRTGLLIEPEDVDGLVRAVSRLRDDEGLRADLGRGGREAVIRGDSSWAASARQTVQLYEELLKDRGAHVRDRG